jgi:hypothetical protein
MDLLICVESGMSIEHAFRKVSQEIGVQSVPLAEEFTLATAELAYLPDRRQAFEKPWYAYWRRLDPANLDRPHPGGEIWDAPSERRCASSRRKAARCV